jgi:hypothetical protein
MASLKNGCAVIAFRRGGLNHCSRGRTALTDNLSKKRGGIEDACAKKEAVYCFNAFCGISPFTPCYEDSLPEIGCRSKSVHKIIRQRIKAREFIKIIQISTCHLTFLGGLSIFVL